MSQQQQPPQPQQIYTWLNLKLESICNNEHSELPLGSFLTIYHEEHRMNSKKCRERSSSHTYWLLATARSHWASSKPDPQLFVNLNLIDKWSAVWTIKQILFDLEWVNVVAYLCWQHVHEIKLFQSSHNCVIPTVKKTKRDISTHNKGFGLQSPSIHPQFQGSCAFAKICLAHRWTCPPAS